MVSLPPEFAATWLPGYFWHTTDRKVYSIKIDGVLKPIKKVYPNRFNNLTEPGFRVSHQGHKRFMSLSRLEKLTRDDATIPVKE